MRRMEKSVEKSEEMTAAIDGLIGGPNGRVGGEIGGVIRRRSWAVQKIEASVEKSKDLMDRAVGEVEEMKVGVDGDVKTIDKKRNY